MIKINDPLTIPGNFINGIFFKYFSKIRGRAWLLKKLIYFFPGLNNASLVLNNIKLPLDLKNDADCGYFFGQGISHEIFFLKLLISLMDKNSVVFDIGSNIGFYSLLISSGIKKVYAFEPNPLLARRIEKVITKNAIQNIELLNVGVSKKNSRLPFYYNDSRHDLGSFLPSARNTNKIEVSVVTLDSIIKESKMEIPSIIKIDTEGLELDILEGYKNIHLHKPIVIMEWLPAPGEENQMVERLKNLLGAQYEIFKIGVVAGVRRYNEKGDEFNNILLMPVNHNKWNELEKWIINSL